MNKSNLKNIGNAVGIVIGTMAASKSKTAVSGGLTLLSLGGSQLVKQPFLKSVLKGFSLAMGVKTLYGLSVNVQKKSN